ncbi:MAG: phospho-sugar mutase [Clostridiales bacterium]|jgi:phosphoglucomutase|nr:phospho-sugar mutase [Clostridiales bacterium]
MQIYQEWLKQARDPEVVAELAAMAGDERRIKDAFYKELTFGTGGLRGILGAGTNCLNVYTIRKITRGLAAYLRAANGKSVCIAYDSRRKSDVFARCAAEIFAQNGIKAYIARELMPTPFLSFATRFYRAAAGVMVTASHNPAQYNGYKVYGADGCQLTDAAAGAVAAHIEKAAYFGNEPAPFEEYIKAGAVEYMPDTVEGEYLNAVQNEAVGEEIGADFSVAYSPLNGTGYRLVPEILKRAGVRAVYAVPEQAQPDGNFPTCPYPNPEKKEALSLVLDCARRNGADMALATDPDADRVGIAVRHGGDYILMTGNEVGVLLCEYILSAVKIKNPVVVKTIVTTVLGEKVARDLGADVIDVLTGFKYIGEAVGELEKRGEAARFALGFEESYGYLKGSYVRDKDAVVASMLICEMAAYHKKRGKTLKDAIDALYAKYGLCEHKLFSFEFAGADGNTKMRTVLSALRSNPPRAFAGISVVKITDYLTQTETKLPKSDVLKYNLDGGNQIIVRPSGTEPLIKIYATAFVDKAANAAFFEKVAAELKVLF